MHVDRSSERLDRRAGTDSILGSRRWSVRTPEPTRCRAQGRGTPRPPVRAVARRRPVARPGARRTRRSRPIAGRTSSSRRPGSSPCRPAAPPGMSVVVISPVSRSMSSRSPCAVSPTSWIPVGSATSARRARSTTSGGPVVVVVRGRVVDGARPGRVDGELLPASCQAIHRASTTAHWSRGHRRTGRRPRRSRPRGRHRHRSRLGGGCDPRAAMVGAVASVGRFEPRRGAAWSVPRPVRSRSTHPLTLHHTTTPSGGAFGTMRAYMKG